MSLKEKTLMSASGLIVFSVNLFLYCKFYPGAVLTIPMIGGLFFAIVPWIGGKMIERGVQRIELWEISENGKRRTLIRELSETERKIIVRAFRKHPRVVNKGGASQLTYGDTALHIVYKDRKPTIYPVQENERCFVFRDKKNGIIMKEEAAREVNRILYGR